MPQTVNNGANGTTVTAVPNTGYHFANWSDGSTANPRTDTKVTANISVTANFAINTRLLTVLKTGTGSGTIMASLGTLTWNGNVGTGNYPENTKVTLTATPNAGSTFSGWAGICYGPETAISSFLIPRQRLPCAEPAM